MRKVDLIDTVVRDNCRFFINRHSAYHFYQSDTDGRIFMIEQQSLDICLVYEVSVTVRGDHKLRLATPVQLDSLDDAIAYVGIFDAFDTTTPHFPTNKPEPELVA